jgi:hypothetical protein
VAALQQVRAVLCCAGPSSKLPCRLQHSAPQHMKHPPVCTAGNQL